MIAFNFPTVFYTIIGLVVLFYCFASAVTYASNGKKFEEITNPYEKFLLTKILTLTDNKIANIACYSLFLVALWPFHTTLIIFGYYYNK